VKVALVHDYLTEMGGAERVVLALTRIFPEAPLYTSVYDPRTCAEFVDHHVRTTFMQRLTRRKVVTKSLFPLFPAAFRRLDLSGFDVVISSSSGFAHHVRVPKETLHICYCHNPPRFLWQPGDYFRGRRLTELLLRPALMRLRRLDLDAAQRVVAYVANSEVVAGRIRETYGRRAEVIHPPIDTARYEVTSERSGHFLVVSRLLAYKRIDLALEAATSAGLPLDVIGDGPERRRLERMAGPSVKFLGRRSDDFVRNALARCTALVLPAAEDFGLTPIEVQASGRPPIAFAGGGALETVRDGDTGFLFCDQTPEALAETMRRATAHEIDPQHLRAAANRFDIANFNRRVRDLLAKEVTHADGLEPQSDGTHPRVRIHAHRSHDD
jgi:glycosyltransferase involved in cell wall biosynthesis